MELKDLLLKTAGQLKTEEREFIKQHVAELTDEDKDAYAVFLNSPADAGGSEGKPSAGAADAGGNSGGEGDAGGSADQGGGAAPSNQPAYVFKTEEDAQKFVKDQIAQNEKDKQAAIDAAATPAEKKWVEDTWKPQTWNEGIKTAAEAAVVIMEEKQAKANKAAQEHNTRVEADWQALRTEHKLPDLRNDDGSANPEGLKLHDAIVDIGTKMGKTNFKDAYEVYMMIPVEKGGGYQAAVGTPTPPTPSEAGAALAKQKQDKMAQQKKVASQIGGQNPGGAAGQGTGGTGFKPTYEDLKTKSRAKLLKEALAA